MPNPQANKASELLKTKNTLYNSARSVLQAHIKVFFFSIIFFLSSIIDSHYIFFVYNHWEHYRHNYSWSWTEIRFTVLFYFQFHPTMHTSSCSSRLRVIFARLELMLPQYSSGPLMTISIQYNCSITRGDILCTYVSKPKVATYRNKLS